MSHKNQNDIIRCVEKNLGINCLHVSIPQQGMSGEVFVISDENHNEYVIKITTEGENELLAFNLIIQNNLSIPIPKLISQFGFEDKNILILEKISFPLLEAIPNKSKCIPSIIENLKKIHSIKFNQAGPLTKQNNDPWKNLLLLKYSENNPEFNWDEIVLQDLVDKELIKSSIKNIKEKIEKQSFLTEKYSLIHTDFNQRNLFINPENNEVSGIIDWGEAMFGDPLYDFARVRMFIWHFNLGEKTLENYFNILNLSDQEKKLEELYFVHQILIYIAWYSEVNSEFTNGRLKLHQDFLREYQW